MASTFYLSNNTADLSGGTHFNVYLEQNTTTAGSLSINAGTNTTWVASYAFTRQNIPDNPNWESGSITVNIRTIATDRGVEMYMSASRISSTGTVLQTSGVSATQELTFNGDFSFTIPSTNWSSGNASDRLRINVFTKATHHKQNTSSTIEANTANASVSTPITISPFDVPTVFTNNATNVGLNSATLNGSIGTLGSAGSVDVFFEWRQLGSGTWNQTTAVSRSATGAFSNGVSGLSSGTSYEFRAVLDYEHQGTQRIYGSTLTLETEKDTYTLTVQVVGNGSTTPTAGSSEYSDGTIVDLIASPNTGSHFVKWVIDGSDVFTSSSQVTMTGNKTVTAYFGDYKELLGISETSTETFLEIVLAKFIPIDLSSESSVETLSDIEIAKFVQLDAGSENSSETYGMLSLLTGLSGHCETASESDIALVYAKVIPLLGSSESASESSSDLSMTVGLFGFSESASESSFNFVYPEVVLMSGLSETSTESFAELEFLIPVLLMRINSIGQKILLGEFEESFGVTRLTKEGDLKIEDEIDETMYEYIEGGDL